MSETKHTPAPWSVGAKDYIHGVIPVNGERYTLIAAVNIYRNEGDGNAKLIAAAPELLATVLKLMAAIDYCLPAALKVQPLQEAYKEGWAIVEKATGQKPDKFL